MVFVVILFRITLFMKASWSALEVEALRGLFEKESNSLKAALLNGATWEELQDQRKKVTELSIALHKKIQAAIHAYGNPAEALNRTAQRRPR